MAALALGLAGTAIVVVPSMTAQANTADLVVDYACQQGIATSGSGTVYLRTKLTVPTTLNVGDPLNVAWKLNYKDATRFGAPARLPNGGRIEVTGRVNLTGSWIGQLQPKGSVDQPGAMIKGTPLNLPDGIADFAYTDREGTLTVKPGKLFVDFRPPASEVMVNDDDPAITYSGGWENLEGQPSGDNDYHLDLHRTTVAGAWASLTFTGTGVDYVAQRDRRAGPIDIAIDGQPGTPPRIDPSTNDDGTPVNDANKGGQTLWKFRGLKYGEHTITIKNVEDAKWGQLDAFRVVTRELVNPPQEYRAECTLISAPVGIEVTIGGGDNPASPSPDSSPDTSASPDSSASPSGSASASPSATPSATPSPSPSGDQSPSPSPSPSASRSPNLAPTQNYVVAVVTQGSPSPTATKTVTLTATPTVAQVAITPQGGAQTGEAPERVSSSGMLLIGSGGALLMIGMLSGVAMLRRRAAHSGERS
ncbi:hypothetical protein IL992_35120 [Microbispora sp. NEAU-D428]|uniref:hypothetical protein n=1 Tax=Microbispora sitophila TaxID=2771537 RepID=UPI00186754F8|nr:hypothetical protein [Microbispora sitophila]MBE3014370.1 hypothetical protein [Microbispora sitophila]